MNLPTALAVTTMLAWSAVARTVGRLSRWLDERTRSAAVRAQAHMARDRFVNELRRERMN